MIVAHHVASKPAEIREPAKPRSRDPRTWDRSVHHKIEGRRHRAGVTEVQFEGYWFGGSFPNWVFTQDVFFIEAPNGIFLIYEYSNPAVFAQAVFVE